MEAKKQARSMHVPDLATLIFPAAGPIEGVIKKISDDVCKKVASAAPFVATPSGPPTAAAPPIGREMAVRLDNGITVIGRYVP